MLLFIVIWLTAYRITRLLLDDSLFERQRGWFYRWFPPRDTAYLGVRRLKTPAGKTYWGAGAEQRKPSWIGDLFYCYWCIGFWISGAVVGVVTQYSSLPLPVLWWFATSTAVGLTARNLDHG